MIRKVLTALLLTAVIIGIAASGILYRPDNVVSDRLYQRTSSHNPEIVIFGIDPETLDVLGPADGLRGAMARVISILNAEEKDRPAVIGIDVMYTGENPENTGDDLLLAEAAGQYDNVVAAADIRFGNEYTDTESGLYQVSTGQALGIYEPFAALKEAADYGIVNALLDRDGIFRHALLYADVPDAGRVYSFAYEIWQKWCRETGAPSGELPAVSENGLYYLPFSQEAEGYWDGISLLDVYQGGVDPYFYRNKIVLIGPTASGLQDEYYTSLNHAKTMPGIAIHANIIEAFQKGSYPKEGGKYLQLLILSAFCFLLAFFFQDRKVVPSVIGCLAVCLAWFFVCRIFYDRFSIVLHVLWVPFGAGILFLLSLILNLIRSRNERRQIRDTFGHYIDPAVLEQLLADGPAALELGGRTEQIAVLFVDVRGFTAMSASLEAQTVVEIINRYLTLTTDCIMKNHGTLDKFVGDCTMAIWNAPIRQENPTYLA